MTEQIVYFEDHLFIPRKCEGSGEVLSYEFVGTEKKEVCNYEKNKLINSGLLEASKKAFFLAEDKEGKLIKIGEEKICLNRQSEY